MCILLIRNFYKYLRSIQSPLWDASDSKTRLSAKFFRSRGWGANKTQIVYSSYLNFHTVGSYLNLLINNGLAERVVGDIVCYRIAPKGEEALGHMPEMEEGEEIATE